MTHFLINYCYILICIYYALLKSAKYIWLSLSPDVCKDIFFSSKYERNCEHLVMMEERVILTVISLLKRSLRRQVPLRML